MPRAGEYMDDAGAPRLTEAPPIPDDGGTNNQGCTFPPLVPSHLRYDKSFTSVSSSRNEDDGFVTGAGDGVVPPPNKNFRPLLVGTSNVGIGEDRTTVEDMVTGCDGASITRSDRIVTGSSYAGGSLCVDSTSSTTARDRWGGVAGGAASGGCCGGVGSLGGFLTLRFTTLAGAGSGGASGGGAGGSSAGGGTGAVFVTFFLTRGFAGASIDSSSLDSSFGARADFRTRVGAGPCGAGGSG
jgi:hypothetical protein